MRVTFDDPSLLILICGRVGAAPVSEQHGVTFQVCANHLLTDHKVWVQVVVTDADLGKAVLSRIKAGQKIVVVGYLRGVPIPSDPSRLEVRPFTDSRGDLRAELAVEPARIKTQDGKDSWGIFDPDKVGEMAYIDPIVRLIDQWL